MTQHVWLIHHGNAHGTDYFCENCGQAVWRSVGDTPESTSAYGPKIMGCEEFQAKIERAIQLSRKLQMKLSPYFME